jgi:Golgi phosphoprotein 3
MTKMPASRELHLYEELMLLELDDEKGHAGIENSVQTNMAGAILAELALSGHIRFGEDKYHRVERVPGKPRLSNPLLAEALELIKKAKKPKPAQEVVEQITNLKDFYHRAARGLVKKGVLKEREDKVLWVFKRRVYPESDPGPEKELRLRLQRAVMNDHEDVSPETVAVLAMAKATGLIKKLFAKDDLKKRKQHIEDLVSGQKAGKATRQAVEAMQMAIAVATIIPAITVTTITTTS